MIEYHEALQGFYCLVSMAIMAGIVYVALMWDLVIGLLSRLHDEEENDE